MVILGKTLTKQHIPKIIGFSVIGLLVLGALVYGGLVWNEKQQFNQAEKEMDALAAQITEKIGKPDQQKKEKSCGYANREFSRGPRSCWINYFYLYEHSDAAASNEKMATINKVIGFMLKDELINNPEKTFHKTTKGGDQRFVGTIQTKGGKSCSMSLSYPVSPFLTDPFTINQPENLLVSIICSDNTMAEYYPVMDK